jgi:glucose-6-phosphate dehydrogenase assembly protein OpcA
LQVDVELKMTNPSSGATGIQGVRMHRASGTIELERNIPNIATLKQPGQPTHDISLPRRNLRDCLAEELRRLDPDDLFGEVIRHGIDELEEPISAGSATTARATKAAKK